ncbi:MAG: rhomboid family intramembrane serine protease [Pseudomonadota bacterium]
MQLHRPDPDFLTSGRAKANFALALRLTLAALALLWAVHIVNFLLGYPLNRFGIVPRSADGFAGVFLAPLLHGSFGHLLHNTVPLFVLGTGMLYVYPNASVRVLPMVYIGGGLLVWLVARSSIHIGASGVLYGMLTYVLLSGLLKRDTRAIALSMLVFFLYGGLGSGLLPGVPGISFESHLAGAALGVVGAWRFRQLDIPPRKVYDWENEDEDQD